MNQRAIVWVAAVCLATVSVGRADQVKTTAREKANLSGRVVSVTPQEVDFEALSGGTSKQIPVNEIISISYEDEPSPLTAARRHALEGNFDEALTALEKITTVQDLRREIKEDVAYYKAYCMAQLALSGNGNLVDAGKQMVAFTKNSPNSYHYYQACELVGNLLVANNLFDKAETYYGILAKTPWPDYKMRAGIAMGRALLAQGKPAEAAKAFDEVVLNEATGDLAERQRMVAKVGKARCLAAAGKLDMATRMLEEIIAKADADNVELHAVTFNALGTALRKANKPKEAMFAFLRVELHYSSNAEAHAEALANLEELFNELHKPDHARRMRQILDEQYKNSRWAKGVK